MFEIDGHPMKPTKGPTLFKKSEYWLKPGNHVIKYVCSGYGGLRIDDPAPVPNGIHITVEAGQTYELVLLAYNRPDCCLGIEKLNIKNS